MPDVTYRQRYDSDGATASSVEAVAREVLAELADPDSEASRAAARAGLDLDTVAGSHIEVTEDGQGADPLTAIIIGIAVSAGSKVAETLWKEVIWPRIRRRLGVDALGPPSGPPEEG